jgi:hypothetical protein
MRTLIILLSIFALSTSCHEVFTDDTVKDSSTVILPRADTVHQMTEQEKKELYMSIGNPDTALAMFIYESGEKFNYSSQREDYIRLDLEGEKIFKLYRYLYGDKPDYEAKLALCRANQRRFLEMARQEVKDNIKKYGEVSDMPEYEYLEKRKDSLLTALK